MKERMERRTWSADFQVGSAVLRRSRLAFSKKKSGGYAA
jgi:hypothetical protein